MPRFTNVDGSRNPHGLGTVLKWKLGLHDGRKIDASALAEVPRVANDGTALRGALHPSLTWIGHASYLVQLGGRSLLIDPVFSARLAVIPRNGPPGLAIADLPRIDVVLVTHNHRDHMDAPSLRGLGPAPVYVVPQGLGPWFVRAGLPRVVELAWWEQREIEGFDITFVPSQHWSRRGLFDENETLWGGYVIARDGVRVYHSGDTAWFDGFAEIGRRVGPIEAAMLPIGAYEPRWFMRSQHMDPVEAIDAFEALGAQRFVAMHWGTFKLTDEDLLEPPMLLREHWERRGLADARREIPAIGETIRLDRDRPRG
ncbi:MAG: MBL fold metallo-hydrolase [Deltaproteobacteria bacterium]|nr:MBL fold metallo-hydrolase [Nannocystaceae bacterium]